MIIFDLDGTLADCEHRRHFVQVDHERNIMKAFNAGNITLDEFKKSWKPDWNSFHEDCHKDLPVWPVVTVMESLFLNNVTLQEKEIQIWSGRCESVRDKTEYWLKYIVGENTYSKLQMRPIGDSTPDDVLKEKWLDEALAEGKKIECVFDDRPKVLKMWRRRGIFVFDCNQTKKEF